MTHKAAYSYGFMPDTGYTRLCTDCEHRSGVDPRLIGRPRELRIFQCDPCAQAERERYQKRNCKSPISGRRNYKGR